MSRPSKRVRDVDWDQDEYHDGKRSYILQNATLEVDNDMILHIPLGNLSNYIKRVMPVPNGYTAENSGSSESESSESSKSSESKVDLSPMDDPDDDDDEEDEQLERDYADVMEERLEHILKYDTKLDNEEKFYIMEECSYNESECIRTSRDIVECNLDKRQTLPILNGLELNRSMGSLSTNDMDVDTCYDEDDEDLEDENESEILYRDILEIIDAADITDAARYKIIDYLDVDPYDIQPLDLELWSRYLVERERVEELVAKFGDNIWDDECRSDCEEEGGCDVCLKEIEDEEDQEKEKDYQLQYCEECEGDGIVADDDIQNAEGETQEEQIFNAHVEACEAEDERLDQIAELKHAISLNENLCNCEESDCSEESEDGNVSVSDLRIRYMQSESMVDKMLRKIDVEQLQIAHIRREQMLNDLVFDQKAFQLLVHEIMQDYSFGLAIEPEVIEALQTAAEDYLVEMFYGANLHTVARDSDIVECKDIQLWRRTREEQHISV